MKKKKYKIGKFVGGYNYRGYCVYGTTGHYCVKDDDGVTFLKFTTLAKFKKYIDSYIKSGIHNE